MRADERKTVVMIFDLRQRNLPTLHTVALFATRAELPLMNVGVAVRTFRAHVREYRLRVTLRAGHALV